MLMSTLHARLIYSSSMVMIFAHEDMMQLKRDTGRHLMPQTKRQEYPQSSANDIIKVQPSDASSLDNLAPQYFDSPVVRCSAPLENPVHLAADLVPFLDVRDTIATLPSMTLDGWSHDIRAIKREMSFLGGQFW